MSQRGCVNLYTKEEISQEGKIENKKIKLMLINRE